MKDVHFEWHLFLSSLPFEEGVSTNAVNKEKVSYINSRLFFLRTKKKYFAAHFAPHLKKPCVFFLCLPAIK